jgi:hypothetical protein
VTAPRSSRWLGLALLVACALGLLVAEPGAAAPANPASQAAAARRAARHGSVTQGMDCSACHTPESWKGLRATSQGTGFDHSKTGFPLTGHHREVSCAGCHGAERQASRICANCHQDAHQGQLGTSCDGCHSAAGWQLTNAFARHRQTRLPLTGMHALLDCRECHQRTAERTWTTVAADCFACHEAEYRRPHTHPLHVGIPGDPTAPPLSRDCAQCHRTIAWTPAFVSGPPLASGAQALSDGGHDRVFPVSFGPHRGAQCASCHTSPSLPQAVRCNGCHEHDEQKLRTQHRGVAGFGMSCLGCHPGGAAR